MWFDGTSGSRRRRLGQSEAGPRRRAWREDRKTDERSVSLKLSMPMSILQTGLSPQHLNIATSRHSASVSPASESRWRKFLGFCKPWSSGIVDKTQSPLFQTVFHRTPRPCSHPSPLNPSPVSCDHLLIMKHCAEHSYRAPTDYTSES